MFHQICTQSYFYEKTLHRRLGTIKEIWSWPIMTHSLIHIWLITFNRNEHIPFLPLWMLHDNFKKYIILVHVFSRLCHELSHLITLYSRGTPTFQNEFFSARFDRRTCPAQNSQTFTIGKHFSQSSTGPLHTLATHRQAANCERWTNIL